MGDRWKALLVTAAGLVMAVLVLAHVPGLNGPWYYKYPWQRLPVLELYPPAILAGLLFLGAQWMYERRDQRRGAPVWALRLLMAYALAMELALCRAQSREAGLATRVNNIVVSPFCTSFFSASRGFHRFIAGGAMTFGDVMAHYPEFLAHMDIHARTKPPGPVLYYLAMIRLFGESTAPVVGGMLIGVVATLCVPATYALIRALPGGTKEAAFCGASYMALCPSLALFFPYFDQIYPAGTAAAATLWVMALRAATPTRALTYAAGCGLVLAATSFFAYNALASGIFLAGFGVLWAVAAVRAGEAGRAAIRASWCAAAAVAAFVGFWVVLWAATGFNVIAHFREAMRRQEEMARHVQRPFPQVIPFDLADFMMGMGWVWVLLAAFWLVRSRGWGRWVAVLAVVQVLALAATGLLRGETSRVWLFLIPLAIVPAALELATWGVRERACAYFAVWLAAVTLAQNMVFIDDALPDPMLPAAGDGAGGDGGNALAAAAFYVARE